MSIRLSKREAQIVEHVARGTPDKVIAHELGISIHTVRTHIERVAAQLPGGSSRRHRVTLFFLDLSDPE